MGWTPIDDRWHYVTPELSVNAEGVLSSSPEVALEHRLRDYGLAEASWDEALKAFRATVAVFPRDLASVLIAFTLLPLVQRFFLAPRRNLPCTWSAPPAAGRARSPPS
ncbi:MAG: hypothetical protein IPK19_37920 [Chloroflexi bacterium]|nr:hypothetical protein [Chloroflexota bacterium]